MSKSKLKKCLTGYFQDEIAREGPAPGMEETIRLCAEITRRQAAAPAEPRLGFWQFLSGVFRFEWPPIVFFQAAALLLVGLYLYGAPRELKYIPVCVPLFALAVIPVLFQGQYFGTGELESATRASTAQLVLARLILSGAADLVCMTVLLGLEVRLTGGRPEPGRIILYCLVPYLVCMTGLLHLIRRRKKDGLTLSIAMSLGSCLFWRASSRVVPGLYELSAMGAWIAAFTVFSAFFAREIGFILKANREGKLYGTIL